MAIKPYECTKHFCPPTYPEVVVVVKGCEILLPTVVVARDGVVTAGGRRHLPTL